jgi:hypothetical protein
MGAVLTAIDGSDAAAVPRPEEKGKSQVFPAGRYVLAGGPAPAVGDDVTEIMDGFRMKPGQYILSGGPNPTDEIVVDDDLRILQNGKSLFVDDDRVASTEKRGKQAARYQGQPIILVVDAKAKLRITATDCCASDAILGDLWLHRHDGAKRKLNDKIVQGSVEKLPHVFFDEEFDLGIGFEMPATIRAATGSVIDLPERPAMLLPKNKGKK